MTAVNITVNDVQFLQDTDGDGEGEVVSAEGFEGPKKINLLQLANGLTASLGDIVIPTGHVSQIRLILDAPERGNAAPVNPGCSIEFSDQPSETLFIPSGGSSGFKLTGAFDVPLNGSVAVIIDFDVRKSIVSTGGYGDANSGSRYILKPALRLVVDDEAGKIAVDLSNYDDYTAASDLILFAYEKTVWDLSEAGEPPVSDNPDEQLSRFPNAVTSVKVDESTPTDNAGNYVIHYLAPGSYTVVLSAYNADQFVSVLGTADVEVKADVKASVVMPLPQ